MGLQKLLCELLLILLVKTDVVARKRLTFMIFNAQPSATQVTSQSSASSLHLPFLLQVRSSASSGASERPSAKHADKFTEDDGIKPVLMMRSDVCETTLEGTKKKL